MNGLPERDSWTIVWMLKSGITRIEEIWDKMTPAWAGWIYIQNIGHKFAITVGLMLITTGIVYLLTKKNKVATVWWGGWVAINMILGEMRYQEVVTIPLRLLAAWLVAKGKTKTAGIVFGLAVALYPQIFPEIALLMFLGKEKMLLGEWTLIPIVTNALLMAGLGGNINRLGQYLVLMLLGNWWKWGFLTLLMVKTKKWKEIAVISYVILAAITLIGQEKERRVVAVEQIINKIKRESLTADRIYTDKENRWIGVMTEKKLEGKIENGPKWIIINERNLGTVTTVLKFYGLVDRGNGLVLYKLRE